MRRLLLALVGLALAGAAGTSVYMGAARDRDYRRLVAEGDRSLAADQTFLAIEAYSGAIALKNQSMLAYLRRGETYRRRGDLGSALRDLREASRLDPTATRPLEQLGDVLYALQRYARAAERYSEYVRLDNRSPRVLYKLALSHYRERQVAAAIPALRKAVQLNERFAEAHYLLGICLREQQRGDEALESLRRAVVLAPASIQAREALASQYAVLGRINEKLGQLEALVALDTERADRLITLGLAYATAHRSDDALGTLRRAAERFPDQPQIYLALARFWLDEAEARHDRVALGKALEALQNAGGALGASSEALTLQGRALLLAGDSGVAERVLQQATTLVPAAPEGFRYLADAAAERRDFATARAALIRYDALAGPGLEAAVRAAACTRIGELSLLLNEPLVAAEWFGRAAEIVPPTAELLGRLVDASARAGHAAPAREALARALAREPKNPNLLSLNRRLQNGATTATPDVPPAAADPADPSARLPEN